MTRCAIAQCIIVSSPIGAEAAALKAGAGTFASASAASVAELRAHGVRFLACRETIARWAQYVAVA